MTNRKTNSENSRFSSDRPKDKDWEFSVDQVPKENFELQETSRRLTLKRPEKLVLDEAAVPKSKTRSAMAQDMKHAEENSLNDEYNLAPLYKRAIAFGLDIGLLVVMGFFVKFSSPVWRNLIQYFMDNYKLKFLIPEFVVMNAIMGICGFLAIIFLIVIPVSFFNISFGKKIVGLKVRGKEQYTLSISEAFKREIILKPLSILIIVGFITPFISKQRLSIHDMLADTLVIEN